MSVGLVYTVNVIILVLVLNLLTPANFHPPHSLQISEKCVLEVNTENRNFKNFLFFERCVARSLSIYSTCLGEEHLLDAFYIGFWSYQSYEQLGVQLQYSFIGSRNVKGKYIG